MGFNAATVVEPLDFNFNPYYDYTGTITEPSDAAVNRFLKRWWKMTEEIQRLAMARVIEQTTGKPPTDDELKELSDKAPKTVGEALDAMVALDGQDESGKSDGELLADRMCVLIEELSAGSMKVEKLLQVPYRPRAAFIGWLVGELTSGEKGTAGSSSSLTRV